MQRSNSYCPSIVREVLIGLQTFLKSLLSILLLLFIFSNVYRYINQAHIPIDLWHWSNADFREYQHFFFSNPSVGLPSPSSHTFGRHGLFHRTPNICRRVSWSISTRLRKHHRTKSSAVSWPSCSPASCSTIRSLTYTLTVGRMSKRIESKDHTTRRLRS